MTERLRDERFYETTGLDTSCPNWQIKSLSDDGLRGFIIGANNRMAIIDPERLEQANASIKYRERVENHSIFQLLEGSILRMAFAENAKDTKEVERLESLNRDVLAVWRDANRSRESEMQIATCEALISKSTSFRWSYDRGKLAQLNEDVRSILDAYHEMNIRGIL